MKIVLALGGNALQINSKEINYNTQLEACIYTSKFIADLIEEGHEICIVHGNGPQIGQIVSSIEDAHKVNSKNILFPFDVCGAFSQGYIGYHIQNSLLKELKQRNINKTPVTIITEVIVNEKDKAFSFPTKPIGNFYTKEEADILSVEKGYYMKEDAGRGYRRVVPSPLPIDIVEKDAIKYALNFNCIPICCGGGGIPVVRKNNRLIGIDAVIDKDFAAEKLAEIIDSDLLIILTSVDKVYLNYNKSNQKTLDLLTIKEIDKYIKQNQFASGSMLPKIQACKKFVGFDNKKIAIIASLTKAKEAIKGNSGTRIIQ